MKQYLLILLSALVLLQSCKVNHKNTIANVWFVSEYGQDNFNDFSNYALLLRSYDKGNPIVLIYNNTDSVDCRLPYRVIVDQTNHRVKSSNRIEGDSSNICQRDTSLMINLALKFVPLQIIAIAVDTNGNVHVKTTPFEGKPNLIRFSNLKFKTKEYNGWKKIKDNWYELPREE